MFKIIALLLIALYLAFEVFISVLKYRNRNAGVPDELKDVYDDETYLKWKQYSSEKIKIDIINKILSLTVLILLIAFDVFALVSKNIANEYVGAIVVLSIYLGIDFIISIPFSYIDSIKIETKYGFNKSTLKTFIGDEIKSIIISYIFMVGLTMLFILIYNALHEYTIILFSGIVFLFILLFSFLYPFFSKIFNKFKPLEEGELRTKLISLLEKHGYQVRDIKVMDASRRTTKSNAYFAGFGKSKTIVLYDNILNALSENEIVAIFAHEMGHGIHKDTLKNSLISLFNVLLMVSLAFLLVYFKDIYLDFGFNAINYGFAVILLISAVLPFVNTLYGFFSFYLSRRAEYKADEQAVDEGYADELISGLKNLYKKDLGDLNPHPLIVLLSYSHPTLLQRIKHINEYKKNNK